MVKTSSITAEDISELKSRLKEVEIEAVKLAERKSVADKARARAIEDLAMLGTSPKEAKASLDTLYNLIDETLTDLEKLLNI